MIGGVGKSQNLASLLAQQKTGTSSIAKTTIALRQNDGYNFTNVGMGMGKLTSSSTQWDEKVAAGSNNPHIRKIDSAISKIGKTLEEMKELSKMAEGDSLSAEERIDMQIAMTRLQSKLFKETYRLGLEASGEHSSGQIERALNAITYSESELIDLLLYGKEKLANGSYTPDENGVDLSGLSKYTSHTGENDPDYYHTEYDSAKMEEFLRNILSQNPSDFPDQVKEAFQGFDAPGGKEGIGMVAVGDMSIDEIVAGHMNGSLKGSPTNGTRRASPSSQSGYLGAIKRLAYNGRKISAGSRLDEAETAKSDPSASQTITTGILLLDRSSAKEGTQRIDKQLKDLAKMKGELKDLVDDTSAQNHETSAPLEMTAGPDTLARSVPYVDFQDKMFSEQIIKNPVVDKERNGVDLPTLLGDGLSHDQRIKTVRNPVDAFMQRADSFFKDKIFKKLGFSMTSGF